MAENGPRRSQVSANQKHPIREMTHNTRNTTARMNASVTTPGNLGAVAMPRPKEKKKDKMVSEEVSNQELKNLIINLRDDVKTLRDELATLKQELSEKVEENRVRVETVYEEMVQVKKIVADVEKSVESTTDRMDDMEQQRVPDLENKLEKELDELREKLLLTEIRERKMNLVFYNVPTSGNLPEDREDCYETLREMLEKDYELPPGDTRDVGFVNCHRIPVRNRKTIRGVLVPLPLIVKFVCAADRDFFSDHRRIRKDSNTKVVQDLPKQMSQERGRLNEVAYNLRNQDPSRRHFTRIKVKGTKVWLEFKRRSADAVWQTYKDN